MKAKAQAPANIAFIKYWGKRDGKLRIPANSSISMNLSNAYTVTTVEFDSKIKGDTIVIDNRKIIGDEKERISQHLTRIRKLAKIKSFTKVVSQNNFPKASGIASSASGFAALTLAASKAANLNLSEKELSILARLGSGSACRSIPDGFVEWEEGSSSQSSYAHSLYPPDYWAICDLVVIVGEASKKVSSTEGHVIAESSPFYKPRIEGIKDKIKDLKNALKNKDFTKFGETLEAEALNMHTVMMTSKPPLYYWQPETLKIMLAVIELRNKGIEAYFTIDAGPNVHVICQAKDVLKVKNRLKEISGIKRTIINRPSLGARVL